MISVSVVLPVYKGESYLKDAIDSILSQSFRDFELIIVNDASPDNSDSVVKQFSDKRIIYHKNETNLGLVGALNTGLKLSSGKYIARMDQDDIAVPERLQAQFDFMEANPDHVLVGTQVKILGTNEIVQYPRDNSEVRLALMFGSAFAHPAVMFRRDVIVSNNLQYQETYKHAEDYGFWIKLSAYGKMANLPLVGLIYRRHDSQYTKVFSEGMQKSAALIRSEYLKILGVRFSENEVVLYDKLARREVNTEDKELMKRIGIFLSSFPRYFSNTGISKKSACNLAYRRWKRLCMERSKKGLRSYGLFLSAPVSRWKLEPVAHLQLLKNQLAGK